MPPPRLSRPLRPCHPPWSTTQVRWASDGPRDGTTKPADDTSSATASSPANPPSAKPRWWSNIFGAVSGLIPPQPQPEPLRSDYPQTHPRPEVPQKSPEPTPLEPPRDRARGSFPSSVEGAVPAKKSPKSVSHQLPEEKQEHPRTPRAQKKKPAPDGVGESATRHERSVMAAAVHPTSAAEEQPQARSLQSDKPPLIRRHIVEKETIEFLSMQGRRERVRKLREIEKRKRDGWTSKYGSITPPSTLR